MAGQRRTKGTVNGVVSRWISVIAAAAFVASGLSAVVDASPAQAADASRFDPAYIISDYAFYNGSAMTESEIQAFLDSKVANCGNSRCLEDFRETTSTREATPRCARYEGAANESAARILFKVQTACKVSAKALIVTLQKEQGLITTSAPTERQIRVAMGYGCPDTAPCDALYYGFFNQVYTAAAQFQRYRMNPGGYRHPVGSPIAVYLHPTSNPAIANPPECGTRTLTIRNLATAGLYNYTPYTPNAAAMANLYSTGDSCSSYGNRNFWRYYTDWFGSPTTLVPSGVSTGRFSGADRYETSALLSAASFPADVETAFIVTGDNFPDGLAASPAATAASAPLLLTNRDFIPASILAELRRLSPNRIVVVGGEPSVSAAVFQELSQLAPDIQRVAGADRFETATAISRTGFPTGATTAYIARGDIFPDALSAGAAAGASRAPILLVHPADVTAPERVTSALTDLGISKVVIVGAEPSVSAALESSLATVPGVTSVARLSGQDRYATALAVNRNAFGSAGSAYIASGNTFPDAMTAAAVAGATKSPLLLSNGVCTGTSSLEYLVNAGVSSVRFMGSTATLSSTVSEFQTCG